MSLLRAARGDVLKKSDTLREEGESLETCDLLEKERGSKIVHHCLKVEGRKKKKTLGSIGR